ncbi:MAG TPA: hypothetical protein VJ801_04960, partial [Polyangia bacterium]|nr:hypothetical protein [Polyangia bacterium]
PTPDSRADTFLPRPDVAAEGPAPCGQLGLSCCPGSVCTAPLTTCTVGGMGQATCTQCGQTGGLCCPDNSCSGGGCCNRNGNCIAEGAACPVSLGGGTCTANACVSAGGNTCGTPSDPCCGTPGVCTAGGSICVTDTTGTTCQTCGDQDEPCCGTGATYTCGSAKLVCQVAGGGRGGVVTYTCRDCGASGGLCCSGQTCDTGLRCTGDGAGATCE